jgi:DNA-binding Lrp family transcriptional regulator
MDSVDRQIINELQGGFPVCDRPYAVVADRMHLTESELMRRLDALLERGVLSRFGPMFNADRMGGAVTLCAMAVPERDFDAVAAFVNSFDEVAHNYAREHRLNMWFVVAAEHSARVREVLRGIEKNTGLTVYDMPKQEEFFVGLKFNI